MTSYMAETRYDRPETNMTKKILGESWNSYEKE